MISDDAIYEATWTLLQGFLAEQNMLSKAVAGWIDTRDVTAISEWRLTVTDPGTRHVLDTFCNGMACDEAFRSLSESLEGIERALMEAAQALEALDHSLGDKVAVLREWTV